MIAESDGHISSETFKSKPSESTITSHNNRYSSSVTMMGSSSQVDGVYTFSNATAGGVTHNVLGGPMVSPTLPRGPVQFIPHQLPVSKLSSVINLCPVVQNNVVYVCEIHVLCRTYNVS